MQRVKERALSLLTSGEVDRVLGLVARVLAQRLQQVAQRGAVFLGATLHGGQIFLTQLPRRDLP